MAYNISKKIINSRTSERMVEDVLKKLGFDPKSYAVFEIWDRLLGWEANRAKAIGLKGTDLCVEVDSSARLHDLTLRKRQLMKRLNEHFGPRAFISDIIFSLAGSDAVPFSRRKPAARFNRRSEKN
jgi:hypothetical protein